MEDAMQVRDVYLRYNGGPVQQFRAWDANRLIESQVRQGADADEPFVVTNATREEYMAEHRRA